MLVRPTSKPYTELSLGPLYRLRPGVRGHGMGLEHHGLMDRAEAVSLMNKRRDAWLNPDLDGYLSLFADDFVFYGAASSRLGDGQRSRRLSGATMSSSTPSVEIFTLCGGHMTESQSPESIVRRFLASWADFNLDQVCFLLRKRRSLCRRVLGESTAGSMPFDPSWKWTSAT